jgi:hypothetical protein
LRKSAYNLSVLPESVPFHSKGVDWTQCPEKSS